MENLTEMNAFASDQLKGNMNLLESQLRTAQEEVKSNKAPEPQESFKTRILIKIKRIQIIGLDFLLNLTENDESFFVVVNILGFERAF